MLILEWREAARADLLAIVDYISDDNPEAAQQLKDDIEAKVAKRHISYQLPKTINPFSFGRSGRSNCRARATVSYSKVPRRVRPRCE